MLHFFTLKHTNIYYTILTIKSLTPYSQGIDDIDWFVYMFCQVPISDFGLRKDKAYTQCKDIDHDIATNHSYGARRSTC